MPVAGSNPATDADGAVAAGEPEDPVDGELPPARGALPGPRTPDPAALCSAVHCVPPPGG